MMTRKRRRLIFVVSGMACLGVAAVLVLNAFSDDLVFFYSPTQLITKEQRPMRAIRIGGLVEDHSVERADGGTQITFKVTDCNHDISVVYVGVLPSLFREGQGVVAEGKLSATGVLQADSVLAKHDERYMPKEVVDELKAAGRWQEGGPMTCASTATALPPQLTQRP